MITIFRKIEREIATQMSELEVLRKQLDGADANDVHTQTRLLNEISVRSIRLKAVEDLYKKLRD